jgi:hypothetical protein
MLCTSSADDSTHNQQQQHQQQQSLPTGARRGPPGSVSAPIRNDDRGGELEITVVRRTSSSSRQQEQQRRARTSRIHQQEEDGDRARRRCSSASSYVPPPALIVVAPSSRALRGGGAVDDKEMKLRRTATAAALTASGLSSSSVSSETSATSSSSSSSSLDDRIRTKWAEMRAKERRSAGNALALDKVAGAPGRCQGGRGSRSRGVYPRGDQVDDSSDMMIMIMIMIDDDASDATLKVANNNHSSDNSSSGGGGGGAKGAAAAVAAVGCAAIEGPPRFHHHGLPCSTPIFTATLVEEQQDHDSAYENHDATSDPLEIMERAKAAAREETLREAVAATVVIPLGDIDDDEEKHVTNDKDASKASSNRSSKRCRRVAIIVAVLVVVWAAVAGAVVYFVSARAAATPPAALEGGSSLGNNPTSITNQVGSANTTTASSASTSTSTSSIVGTIPYGAASDEALGISGDGSVVAVGTLGDGAAGGGGVVRVFQKQTASQWTEQGVITDDGVEYFGFAMGLSGSGRRLVVGAPGGIEIGDPDVTVPGSVRVYDYDADMNMWEGPYGRIMGPVEGGLFGHSVAISGDASTLAAGAPSADAVGMAQVWRISNETALWEQLGQDLYGDVPDSHFGESTAMSSDGQVLVVGGCGANPMGFSGSVHAYQFDNSTNAWAPLGPAMFRNASMERWGWDVTVSGDGHVMAASANVFSTRNPGLVHVYRYNADAEAWEPHGDALVGELNKRFGYTVSLSHDGTSIAVGIPGIKGVDTGSVQVYSFDAYTHTWSPTIAPEAANGGSPTDGLGEAVALSSDGSFVAASSATVGYTEVIALD